MAIEIQSQAVDATKVYRIRVRLTSIDPIPDPVAYVGQPSVWLQVLAIAGLPTILFVGAELIDQGYEGLERWYTLDMTFDETYVTATGHQHDHNTLIMPLRESYRDGPFIDVIPSLGPVDIWSATANAVEYFRVRLEGGDTYFSVTKEGRTEYGGHQSFIRDSEFDIGSPDDGTTLRRPRDFYLARDLFVGQHVTAAGYGEFGEHVLGTHYRYTAQPSNPNTDPNVRHTYWNSTDNTLRGWDGSVEFILGGGSTALTGITAIYSCAPAVVGGDVVSIVGGTSVAKADATLLGQRPVIGVVVNKLDSTTAVVQLAGEVGTFAGGLIPDQLYFLAHAPGTLTNNPNAFSTGDTVQLVGISKDANTLVLRFESRVLY